MAYYQDLREFILTLEQAGKLVRIHRPMIRETEIMPLSRLQFRGLPEEERKVFLFENVMDVKGRHYPGKVATGIYGASREIYALGMKCAPKEIFDRWDAALAHPIDPQIVSSGPVRQEVHVGKDIQSIGLYEFPLPVEEPGYSGTIRTTNQFVTKDPDTGIRNVGTYSGHLRSPNRLLVGCGLTHHGYVHLQKYRERKTPMPAAIIIGATPNLMQVSSTNVPYGVDEYAVAGAIAGEPFKLIKCETVDLEVPAFAEIVIEGLVSTDTFEPHASFGEYPGYMYEGSNDMRPVMEVTAITHRKDPIVTPMLVGLPPSDNHMLMVISTEATYYRFLKYASNNPNIVDVAFHESGGGWNYCVVSLHKTHPSQPWQVLNGISAFDPVIGKIAIVVDEDIDPHDPDAVNWALSYAMQPHRDVRIITGRSPALDPSGSAPGSSREVRGYPPPEGASAMLIDATRKWPYPPVGLPKKEYMESAIHLWGELGLPPLKLKKPWHGYTLGNWTAEDEENAELVLKGAYREIGRKMLQRQVKK
ncbi:MAG: UbiD family decarboxylase [Desulfobacterales bacterium]|nr:UbiD family decarboxylase [Desulfobacterales bacterium]